MCGTEVVHCCGCGACFIGRRREDAEWKRQTHQAGGACGWREGFRRDAGEYKPLPQRRMFQNKNQEVEVVSMDVESAAVETRKRTRRGSDGSDDGCGWNGDSGEGGEREEEEEEGDHVGKRSKSLLYDRVGRQ